MQTLKQRTAEGAVMSLPTVDVKKLCVVTMDVFYELAIRQSSKLFPVEHKDFFQTDSSTVE